MGSGKSTVGRLLAERLGRTFIDTDALVADTAATSIPQLFATEGEAGFRRREHEALACALARRPPAVVATGGGVVERDDNVALLAAGALVVWLRAQITTLASRLGSGAGRPLLAGDESPVVVLGRLAERRDPRYSQVADLVVDTDGLAAEAIVDVLVAHEVAA